MAEKRTPLRYALYALLASVIAGAAAMGVHLAQALPSGPEPIAWDREACAHCRMQVGDPHYAAQLQTADGQVLDFDDPGCLLSYLGSHKPAVHAIYFRHLRADRWLTASEVGFIDAGPTPMGYGLGAVEASTPGALTMEQAIARTRTGPVAQKGTP